MLRYVRLAGDILTIDKNINFRLIIKSLSINMYCNNVKTSASDMFVSAYKTAFYIGS